MFLTSLKQTCNEYLIKFSENQSAPKLENRKTSPCSPCAPNLPHVLLSRIPGYHNLCSPDDDNEGSRVEICRDRHDQRSCKICAICVNFPGKQQDFLHNLHRTTRFTHTKCDFALSLYAQLNSYKKSTKITDISVYGVSFNV